MMNEVSRAFARAEEDYAEALKVQKE